MAKIYELIHKFHTLPDSPVAPAMDVEAIKQELIKRIEKFEIDGITVENVEVDEYGILVTFVDFEDDQMDVYFVHDEKEGSLAIILGEEEDEDYLMVDLSPLAPSLIKSGSTNYINMTELSWFNKSALAAILLAGQIGFDDDADTDGEDPQADEPEDDDTDSDIAFGIFRPFESLTESQMDELFASVVRGGKRVKLAIVRKIKRRRLSPTKRMGIRRAVRKRKQKASRIARKTKRSLKIRKRLGIKKKSFGKYRKIAGTANRKR